MYFLLPSLLCPLDRLSPMLISPLPPPPRRRLPFPSSSSTFFSYLSPSCLLPLSSPCLHTHTLSHHLTFWKHCYTYHEVTPILSALITRHFSSQLTENSAVKPIDTQLHSICFLQSLSSWKLSTIFNCAFLLCPNEHC